jgi:hypothetical protein
VLASGMTKRSAAWGPKSNHVAAGANPAPVKCLSDLTKASMNTY